MKVREAGVGMLGGVFIHYGRGNRHELNSTHSYFCAQLCVALFVGAGEALMAEGLAACPGTWLLLHRVRLCHFAGLPFLIIFLSCLLFFLQTFWYPMIFD